MTKRLQILESVEKSAHTLSIWVACKLQPIEIDVRQVLKTFSRLKLVPTVSCLGSIQQCEQFRNFCCWHLSIFKRNAPFTLCNNRFPTPLLFHTCSLACYDSPGKLCLLHPAGLLLLLHLKPSSTSSPRLPPLPKSPLDLAPARRVVAPHQVAAREGVSEQKCFELVLCNLVVNPNM